MTTRGVGDAWVGNELRVVSRAGVPFVLHGLYRPGHSYFSSDDIAALAAATRFLYPLPWLAVITGFLAAPVRFRARFFAALGDALFGPRESFAIRMTALWHFVVACHWAATLRDARVSHVHSQWIHSAGTVAMYGAWLLDRSFSFTGHAADLFRNRVALLSKIRRADFIVCISEFHRQFYLEQGARPEQLIVAYCGIDTSHFTPRRRNRDPGEPWRIVASGRLVEKKGFAVLIEACEILKHRGAEFRCTIAGSGPDEDALRAQVRAAGLEDVITITGEILTQEEIPAVMYTGDVYCLPCVWAADNDVDGLPQMLMEAMACGLPAVSTRLVGIPDLIRHEETGLLVEPRDAEGLADALSRLASDPDLAERLAEAGHAWVKAEFDLDTCLEPLLEQYRKRLDAP